MSSLAKMSVIGGLCAALFSVQSVAGVITVNNRADLNALGTIVHNSNFDDFSGSFSFPGNPFTRGDVTFTSNRNLIVGNCSYSIGCARNVMTNDFWTPITGTIATGSHEYELFGFELAVTSGPVKVTLNTNAGTYVYDGLTVANGNPNFTFLGFEATGGEYFTGFRIDTQGSGFLPGMTDIALGNAGPRNNVPEPTGLALAGLALAAVAIGRRRKSAAA